MTQDVSIFGAIVNIIASNTFPAGFTVSQFADDADPIDLSAVAIADKAMGVNGDLITWAKAVPIPVVINVLPNGEDDNNLEILANANRVGQGKTSAYDIITMTIIYPDGTSKILSGGKLTDASFGLSGASSGRLKTKTYTFTFQNIAG